MCCTRCSCRCDRSPYEDTLDYQMWDPASEEDVKEFNELVRLNKEWHKARSASANEQSE